MPGKITTDLSDFPGALRQHALNLVTAFGVWEFDKGNNAIVLCEGADDIRQRLGKKHMLVPMWLSFGVGVECLLKAVLLKNQVKIVRKGRTSRLQRKLVSAASNYSDAVSACWIIGARAATSPKWKWLDRQLSSKNIRSIYDLDTGTMGRLLPHLPKLRARGVLSADECHCLQNALWVLFAIRRNVDAHTFFQLIVGGSINSDMETLYIPAINTLLAAYER